MYKAILISLLLAFSSCKTIKSSIDKDTKIPFGQKLINSEDSLPDSYDFRVEYPDCIPETIKKQDLCNSATAFSGVNALALRFCKATGKYVELSPQDQVSCKDNKCKLGDLVSSWKYYETEGVVSEKCFPFVSGDLSEFPECPNEVKQCSDESEKFIKYKAIADSSEALETADVIKKEIMKNGPVQAGMMLFESFKYYESGIYQAQSGKMLGWHALTLVGWGVEDGVQYFIGLNSWGKDWGENGYIKIEVSTAGISQYGYAGLPDVDALRYPF